MKWNRGRRERRREIKWEIERQKERRREGGGEGETDLDGSAGDGLKGLVSQECLPNSVSNKV